LGIRPQIILERIKNDVRKEAEERVQHLSKIKETEEFTQLDELYKQGINPVKKEDISASLKGKANISNFLKEIIKNAQKEVIICTNAEEMRVKTKLFSQTFELLKKSNVKIKIALFGDSNLIKDVEKHLSVKIKKIDIESKFFIVDRKEIFFYISKGGESGDEVAVWLNSPFFVESFISLFEKAMEE
jgi:sugar-specific transcriptional regulator TrmB